jgi:hypothetical protein
LGRGRTGHKTIVIRGAATGWGYTSHTAGGMRGRILGRWRDGVLGMISPVAGAPMEVRALHDSEGGGAGNTAAAAVAAVAVVEEGSQ